MIPLVSNASHWFYTQVAKPIFFHFDPEFVHNQNVHLGKLLGKSVVARQLMRTCWAYQHPQLIKKLNGITFPNPVGLSAGFDYNGDLTQILPAVGFGFHTIGTITLEPYEGNQPPRLSRFPNSQALLVNKGLKNDGAKVVIQKLKKVSLHIPTGISIASTNQKYQSDQAQIQNMVNCFQLFEKSRLKHAYYELNISCPNTFGGEPFTTPARLTQLLRALDKLKIKRPVYVKMPIDQSTKETEELFQVLVKHRVSGVIIGNLTKDHRNPDVEKKDRQKWLTSPGNLSGKPTWKRSNKLIALARKKFPTNFTIIGTGGIFSAADAQEKIRLGADLVQLITGMIYEGPELIGQINRGLKNW